MISGLKPASEMINAPAAMPAVGRRGRLWYVRLVFWLLALALGALHAYAGAMRQSMNADGIAYLDMGDAYLRGDWSTAINTVWSPLYAWILGIARYVIDPAPAQEFTLVHVVNFLIYVGALVCFEYLLREVLRYQQVATAGLPDSGLTLPAWAWLSVGYSLFIWSSLSLIRVWAITPDMCVAAFVYLAAALLVRLAAGESSWRLYLALGVVLGLGYLAKAAMFPLAFTFLAATLVMPAAVRQKVPRTLLALGTFLLVASPLIAALSLAKGRLTFSETSKLTYAWFVNGVGYPHWQGETPGAGTPRHPTRQILADPPVYEFAAPVGGTYPVAYDPSYWYEGVNPHFEWPGQLRVLLSNGEYYVDLFVREQGFLSGAILLLILMTPRELRARHRRVSWSLILPGLGALGMYALVYAEGRYIGAFVVLLWIGLLVAIALPANAEAWRLRRWASIVILAAVLLQIALFNYEGFRALLLDDLLGSSINRPTTALGSAQDVSGGTPWDIAAALQQSGLRPDDQVAYIGYSFDASWARLARLRIIAEMQDPEAFWAADRVTKGRVVRAFASTSATAIVAAPGQTGTDTSGWQRVGETGYRVFFLTR